MAWTERQTALLRAMGLRTWSAPLPDAAAAPPVVAAEAPAQDGDAPLGWTALRAAVADCTACALHAGRTQPVFGSGAGEAHWLVVGDAPDDSEDRDGEPFTGDAGRLLDAMLRALDLARDGTDPARCAHVVNAVRCRPPRGRSPAADEIDRCRAHLQQQVALVRPRVLLALGRTAIQALLPQSDAALGQLRGRVHTAFGVPVVVTYHPSYLLRNPADKARAWDDLCLAAEVVAGGGVSPS